ncbi:unnamed protein product [Closterium sp. NIES-54]
MSWRLRMAPGQQASAEGMAMEGAEDEGEADLAATTSMEAAGVPVMSATRTLSTFEAASPLEHFRQCLDLRKGVAEVLVAVEKPKVNPLSFKMISAAVSWRVRMAPEQQASAVDMAVEGAEDEEEEGLEAATSTEVA